MNVIYNFVILLWACLQLPAIIFKKKYRGQILNRTGIRLPKFKRKKSGEMRIWIHAVSLGETKAIIPFVEEVRKDLPDATIFFSSITETGHQEVLKLGGKVDHAFYLPLDTSWNMRRLTRRINPDLFVLVEADFWFQLLKNLKGSGAKIAVLNARVSQISFKRYRMVQGFAKKLFSFVDLFCAQSEEYATRFKKLGVAKERIQITGNLKFDIKRVLSPKVVLKFPETKRFVTVASTHANEEKLIMQALSQMDDSLCLLIAPRHPERFQEVAEWLKEEEVPFRFIDEDKDGSEKVVLVNKMGVLDQCYEVSTAAIMGGSFIEGVGGHNIYEPIRFGIPVLYGPHMENQENLVKSLKKHQVGSQVEIADLAQALEGYLQKKKGVGDYQRLQSEMEGATNRCWELVKKL